MTWPNLIKTLSLYRIHWFIQTFRQYITTEIIQLRADETQSSRKDNRSKYRHVSLLQRMFVWRYSEQMCSYQVCNSLFVCKIPWRSWKFWFIINNVQKNMLFWCDIRIKGNLSKNISIIPAFIQWVVCNQKNPSETRPQKNLHPTYTFSRLTNHIKYVWSMADL